jgi:hypothetical protein
MDNCRIYVECLLNRCQILNPAWPILQFRKSHVLTPLINDQFNLKDRRGNSKITQSLDCLKIFLDLSTMQTERGIISLTF